MAEAEELFKLRQKHLIGKLISSNIKRGKIVDLVLPPLPASGALIFGAKEMPESNTIRIMDNSVSVFANEEILFKGQNILAVFAHDSETVENLCNNVHISYQLATSETKEEEIPITPLNWSLGNTDDYFNDKAKVVESVFTVKSHQSISLWMNRTWAVYVDGTLHVKTATQWPLHVRDSVANALSLPKSKVQIYPETYYAPQDQFLINPSIVAVIAAVAAYQSSELVELRTENTTWQPALVFKRSTALDMTGKPLAEKVIATADMGAFAVFPSELCSGILAGLVPFYPLKAMDISIQAETSSNPPSNFFGDLGNSMALASTENHYTQIADALGVSPAKWKIENLPLENSVSESVRHTRGFKYLSSLGRDVSSVSWFERKYAANSQRALKKSINPFVNYSRGIGIAFGQGIFGFSQHFHYMSQYTLQLILEAKDRLIVQTSMPASRSVINIWKTVIQSQLKLAKEDIIFEDINTDGIRDIGPNTLSRDIGVVPALLRNACASISVNLSSPNHTFPIKARGFTTEDVTGPFYDGNAFTSVALELEIDPVKLIPVITKVWAWFMFGRVFDMKILETRLRHAIKTQIVEIYPGSEGPFEIETNILTDLSLPEASITSALRGAITAALTGALSQALGKPINEVPISEDVILSQTRSGK